METKGEKNRSEEAGIPVDHFADYLDNFYRINILKATVKASGIGAGIISALFFCSLLMLTLILATVGLSWWIGDLIKNRLAGFLIVALSLLVIFIVLLTLRKRVLTPLFRNWVIRKFYE